MTIFDISAFGLPLNLYSTMSVNMISMLRNYDIKQKEEKDLSNEVLELITQQLTEIRLDDIVHKNVEYRRAAQEEMALYEHFTQNLSEWQREEFENFLIAMNESALICTKLSYQQGMKDLMALLKSLGQ